MTRGKKNAGRSSASSASSVVAAAIKAVVAPRPTPTRPRPKARNRVGQRTAQLNPTALFLQSLRNPFNVSCPQIAVNNLTLDGSATLWKREYGYGPSGAGMFMAILNPYGLYDNTASGSLGSYALNFSTTLGPGDMTSPLSTFTATSTVPANMANVAASYSALRCNTAGLRATVRYPTSFAPGRLVGLRVTDQLANIASRTLSQLLNLADSHSVIQVTSGTNAIEVRYAWGDEWDTDFHPTGFDTGTLTSSTYLIVLGFGWSSGTVFDIETIAHYDVQDGSKLNTIGSASADTTPVLTESIERLSLLIKDIHPVASQIEMLREDGAFLLAQRNHITSSSSSSKTARTKRRVDAPAVPASFMESVHQTEATHDAGGTVSDYVNVPSVLGTVAAGAAALAGHAAHRGLGNLGQQVINRMQQ